MFRNMRLPAVRDIMSTYFVQYIYFARLYVGITLTLAISSHLQCFSVEYTSMSNLG